MCFHCHSYSDTQIPSLIAGVDEVLLLDRKKPQSYTAIYEPVVEVAPWVAQKVKFVEVDLKTVLELSEKGFASESGPHDESSLVLPTRAAFLSVHACNEATDLSIQIAINCRAASVASMPCCYYSQPIQNQAVRSLVSCSWKLGYHGTCEFRLPLYNTGGCEASFWKGNGD